MIVKMNSKTIRGITYIVNCKENDELDVEGLVCGFEPAATQVELLHVVPG